MGAVKKTILITRPRAEALALARRLEKEGFAPLIDPMLDIEFLERARPMLLEALEPAPQAVILTSRNGAAALHHLTRLRDFPILAVGEATAIAALKAGFPRVSAAGGDVESLLYYIEGHCKPSGGKLVYASGHDISADLPEALQAQGFSCERIIVYRAAAATCLSEETIRHLREGSLQDALFFSERTASIFMALATEAGVRESLRSVTTYALSAKIAERLGHDWKQVRVSEKTDLDSLIGMLKTPCNQ